jgi:hypothetical protein
LATELVGSSASDGRTVAFVASDLRFIGLDRAALDQISTRLVPLVAHDRVGFAGGVIVGGVLVASVAWWGQGRAARQTIAVAGTVAYGATLAVHVGVGYTDVLHLAPALVGTVTMLAGIVGWWLAERGETSVQADRGRR